MENILCGKVEKRIIYQDDICIGASSKKELKQKNGTCFEKI